MRSVNFIRILALILFMLVFMNSIFAQDIVSESNRWNVYATGFPSYLATETYKIDGDSAFNGKEYKKIWMTRDSVDVLWDFQGLLREDSNIVYYKAADSWGGSMEEGVLYDFNAEVGDTVMIINMFCPDPDYPIPAVVSTIDTVEYFGVERKRWALNVDYSPYDYWIEGIGSSLGPLHSLYYLCIVCPTWDLLCYHKNDTLLYQMFGYDKCFYSSVGIEEIENIDISIFPNPVKDRFEIRSAGFELGKTCEIEIFDPRGVKVLHKTIIIDYNAIATDISHLSPGMYNCRIYYASKIFTVKLIKQ